MLVSIWWEDGHYYIDPVDGCDDDYHEYAEVPETLYEAYQEAHAEYRRLQWMIVERSCKEAYWTQEIKDHWAGYHQRRLEREAEMKRDREEILASWIPITEADPELERLLAEEEEFERRYRGAR